MKKFHTLLFCTIFILCLCSCKTNYKEYENQKNYGPTLDFFLHPDGGGKLEGWRCVYDKENNTVIPVTNQNIKFGAQDTSYFSSPYADQILNIANEQQLGQFNDYRCFNDVEFILYWNWGSEQKNTLIIIQDKNIELIEISKGNDVRFLYYDNSNKTVYLADYFIWNNEFTECSGTIFAVDTATGRVSREKICVFNEEINLKFNIDAQMKYPVHVWDKEEISKIAGFNMIADNENLIMCVTFSPLIRKIHTFHNTSFLIKYNLKTKLIQNLTVMDETICHFQKSNDGFITFGEFINKTGIDATSFVERIWMNEYDKNLSLINVTEIECDKFKVCNSVLIYGAGNDFFISGENMQDNSNVLAYYNKASNTMTYAQDVPKGYICDHRFIQKIDGKIINLQS